MCISYSIACSTAFLALGIFCMCHETFLKEGGRGERKRDEKGERGKEGELGRKEGANDIVIEPYYYTPKCKTDNTAKELCFSINGRLLYCSAEQELMVTNVILIHVYCQGTYLKTLE